MIEPPDDYLDVARLDAGLSHGALWLRYFGLGGMTAALDVEAIVYGVLTATTHDRDHIVHALNERFSELGRNHPVPYAAQRSPQL